ncbi:MAG: hypothetical protein AB7T06_26060 [Kofleriaceae bacterium]
MSRFAIACLAVVGLGCSRAQGVEDKELGNLVVAPAVSTEPITTARAAAEPAELSRALMQPFDAVIAALGPHRTQMTQVTVVEEAGKVTSELTETTVIELGDKAAYHGTYGNTADYGREVIFDGTSLFLRPRYQRWHQRAPESPTEAAEQRDKFYAPIAATWELVAPAVELIDKGNADVAGRSGRKIEIRKAPKAAPNPPEKLVQRKWREARVIEDVSGEVILDAEKAVPLSVKLAGTISFMRDGRRFNMKVTLTSAVTAVSASAIAPPDKAEVVATPERLREVDDRDKLLEGIAPPTRRQGESAQESATP